VIFVYPNLDIIMVAPHGVFRERRRHAGIPGGVDT
jgi:hypothetical protein